MQVIVTAGILNVLADLLCLLSLEQEFTGTDRGQSDLLMWLSLLYLYVIFLHMF